MWRAFWAQNIHFSLEVFVALVAFSAGWIFLDSWLFKKEKKMALRAGGFFLYALASIIHAAAAEEALLFLPFGIAKASGLALIIWSMLLEPIQPLPGSAKAKVAAITVTIPIEKLGGLLAVLKLAIQPFFAVVSATLSLVISTLYFRLAGVGLEKQQIPAFKAFLLLAAAEAISFFAIFSTSANIFISKFVSIFGPLWSVEHLIKLVAFVVLGVWVWGYLRFRLREEIFIIFVSVTLGVFLFTTLAFTTLLLQNLQKDALRKLETDVKVLDFAIERLQAEALSDARAVSSNADVVEALKAGDRDKLFTLAQSFLVSMETDFLAITNDAAEVLVRAEDKERSGDSLSDNLAVMNALLERPLVTVVKREGVLTPQVFIEAAVPVKGSGVLGAALTGFIVDDAFVDRVKEITGLDVTVFGGNERSATTFLAPDGKSRELGTLEPDPRINRTVLIRGEIYVGGATVLNQPYFTAYLPLKDVSDEVVGMLFVGAPQTTVLETAQETFQLTFLLSSLLMVFSLIPSYFISRYIHSQIA